MPFSGLKKEVLGKSYDLSVAFVSSAESRCLNKIYRGKNKPANILSFPLGKNEGEIVICPEEARKDAPKFDLNYKTFLSFLFIHGLFHLEGFAHGSTMEKKETVVRKKFGIK